MPTDDARGEEFGGWLSGFCDARAYFKLLTHTNRPGGNTQHHACQFVIELREDCAGLLGEVRDYLGCGKVLLARRPKAEHAQTARFYVNRYEDLARAVVPHFERHPLRTPGKAGDFAIWRECVALCRRVRQAAGKGRPAWPNADRAEFLRLAELLRRHRAG